MTTPPNKPIDPKKPDPSKPTAPKPMAPKPPAPGQRPTVPAAGAAKPGTPPAKPAPAPAAANKVPAPAPAPKKAEGKAAPKKTAASSGTRKLGQILVDLGFIDEVQMEELLEEARNTDSPLELVAVERGTIDENQLIQAQAEQSGMRIVNLDEAKPDPRAIAMVQESMANLYKMLPLAYEGDTLTVVLGDPNNLQAIDDVRNFLGIRQVEACLAPVKKIEAAIARAYSGTKEESLTDVIEALSLDKKFDKHRRETSIDLDELSEMANTAPVRKLINMVLLMAIRDHASDIHFEPFEDEYKMRYRCDGVLYEMVPPPRHLAMAIASRIKVMSNLDIAERRLPQDGRIELNIGGNPVDMRVSILPTMFGESVVVRVLDRTRVGLELERIGLPEDILEDFRKIIRKPNGICLVTGPTGAGKTTTLYSALNELNEITDKCITTEDPVEYEIDGIIQCPINAEIDMTFATALRAILRQDPDRILVGEIRDLETAQIAIQAALTGHMVFSTLHTNDAPSTVTRLRDMGVEPFLITATVEAILAQRLVRKLCQNCKTGYDPSREQLMELNLKPEELKGRQFYFGEGCDKCNNLGFKGRTGIYELLIMNDELRDMISRGASTDQLRKTIRDRGNRGLRERGLDLLYNGLSSLDEIVRETVLEDEG